ncbi:hypothetical protein NHG23_07475 [Aerococcaceae bacterium NML190073]|nr:hypothetical protein [Aerococcaceae bacterium NML190073]
MKKILSAIVVVLLFSFPAKAFSEPDGVLLGSELRSGEYTSIGGASIKVEQTLINKIIETKSLDNSLIPILFSALANENLSIYNEINSDISFKTDEIIIRGNSTPINIYSGDDIEKGFPQGRIYRVIGVETPGEQYLGIIFPYNEKHFYTIVVNEWGIALQKYVPVDLFDRYYELEKRQAELNLENALDALENAYEKKPSPPSFDSNNN